jgi:hypothetical protein
LNLATATVDSFAPHVGRGFELDAGELGKLQLELIAATPGRHPAPDGARHPFTLAFRGPAEPALAQGTYALQAPDAERLEIFIVPVGRDEAGTEYEAVFS